MRKDSRPSKILLNPSLKHPLAGYALAAAAAGVGVLALAPAAHAGTFNYVSSIPTTYEVEAGAGQSLGQSSTVYMLGTEGIELTATYSQGGGNWSLDLYAEGLNGLLIDPARLAPSATLPTSGFVSGSLLLGSANGVYSSTVGFQFTAANGPWEGNLTDFLAFQLPASGSLAAPVQGWAKLGVTFDDAHSYSNPLVVSGIESFSYDTNPYDIIKAGQTAPTPPPPPTTTPEPGSLELLALGCLGLGAAALRRKRLGPAAE